MKKHLAICLILFTTSLTLHANSLQNGDFEQGMEGWKIFNPDENQYISVDVSPDPDRPDSKHLRMTSDDILRFSVASPKVEVQPGETWVLKLRYRLPKAPVSTAPNTPGFLVRATAAETESAHQHIDSEGVVFPVDVPLGKLQAVGADTDWKTIETTFTIPKDVKSIHLDFFFWRMKGELWIDDVVLEKKQ